MGYNKIKNNNSTEVSKTLYILKTLKSEGIDISTIAQIKHVDRKQRSTVLADYLSEDILKKYNLDGQYNIGYAINRAKQAYKGNRTSSYN